MKNFMEPTVTVINICSEDIADGTGGTMGTEGSGGIIIAP